MSKSNASRLTAIFTDYDDDDGGESPYDGIALNVHLASDVLFLNIGILREDGDTQTFEILAGDEGAGSVGVDAELFLETLKAMIRRSDRDAYQRARDGELPADHPALGAMTMPAVVPVTRRRT